MVMMMCGRNKKRALSCRNAGNLHPSTHTPISVVEKIFKVSFREAMSVCSWSNFLCGKRFFIGDRVVPTLSYAIKV